MNGNSSKLFKAISVLLVVVAGASAYCLAEYSQKKFWLMLGIVSAVSIIYLAVFLLNEKKQRDSAAVLASKVQFKDRDSLDKFPVAAAITDSEGTIIYANKSFSEKFSIPDPFGQKLSQLVKVDLSAALNKPDETVKYIYDDLKIYATASAQDGEGSTENEMKILFSFEDISELNTVKNDFNNEINAMRDHFNSGRAMVMFIIIDCYQDIFNSMKGSDKAQIVQKIDELCRNFAEAHNGIIQSVAEDKYFCIMNGSEIEKLEEDKFKSLIDAAHEITFGGRISITLSVGVGRGGSTLTESEEMARDALNMTQRRGGDQAVIKNGTDDYVYFGGVSKSVESGARAKSNMFARQLVKEIEKSDRVILMGHSYSDFDAVGSAAGLCGAIGCMANSREAFVCVNESTTLAKTLIDRLRTMLDRDIFISGKQAEEIITDNTLLIVTDASVKTQLDSQDVYAKAKRVVYIDHHIEKEGCIDNDIINLRETQASSASEMISEIIQYFSMKEELSSYFADALLTGIYLDTKAFVVKTTARTFEAASYLRSLGADTVVVKKMFAISKYIGTRRSELITNCEIYNDFAISVYRMTNEDGSPVDDDISTKKTAAAQAADELLNIEGVDASFVLYQSGSGVGISARAYSLNVESIVKRLGGSGHQISAGAYLKDTDYDEVMKLLKEAIDDFSYNG